MHIIQKLPFNEGQGQPGKVLKEATVLMEVLPSQPIIAKKADGVDTRLAQLDQPMVTNPLEKFLGAHQFGTYNKYKTNKDFAFVWIEDLWQEEVDDNDNSDKKAVQEETTRTPAEPSHAQIGNTTLEPVNTSQ
jgi:hypothetical protein